MKKALVGIALVTTLLASGCVTSGSPNYWEAAKDARVNASQHLESLAAAEDATANARGSAEIKRAREREEKWRAVYNAAAAAALANVSAAIAIESRDVYRSVLDDGTELTDMASAASEASSRAVEASSAIYEAEIAEMDYRKAAIDAGAWTEE